MAKSKTVNIRGKKTKLTIRQPKRDAEGKTKIDRQIARNKSKSLSGKRKDRNNPTLQNFTPASGGIASGPDQNFTPAQPSQLSTFSSKLKKETGGFEGIRERAKVALNPFSSSSDSKRALGLPENTQGGPPIAAFSALPQQFSSITGAVNFAKRSTAVNQAAKVGTNGFAKAVANLKGVSTASTFATNTATTAKTVKLLTKAGFSLAAVGTVKEAIGSYPFAGFIKEEALQTIGFAVSTAIRNGDIAGAEEALALQEEVLNPTAWDNVKAAIPFVNVLSNLKDFNEAARIKGEIDKRIVADMKVQLETGETNEQREERVQSEEKDQYQKNIDYYNNERKKLIQYEQEAKQAANERQAKFWAAEAKKQRALEEADRRAIAEFWFNYRKQQQKLADNNRPSKLNFGLL